MSDDARKEYFKEYGKTHREQINKAAREYKARNKKKIKEREKEYCARPEIKAQRKAYRMTPRGRYAVLKSVSKQRGIDCFISFKEYGEYIKDRCHYCCGTFRKIEDHEGYFIDRVDNKVGYVIGNCIPCCYVCNRIKGDNFTYEETKAAVDAILMLRG